MNNELITLTNRSLVLVSGKDSEDFLQSIITIDLSGNAEKLLSSCFLSPQGKLLNQFLSLIFFLFYIDAAQRLFLI